LKISWLAILLVVTAVAYTGLFLSLSSDPFTDAPNHLARAAVMKSLWFDPQSPFEGTFSAGHSLMPYVLPDVALVLLIQLLGFARACSVWSTFTMLILASAVWFYARQVLTTAWGLAAAMLGSFYFATNYLFILGFFSFQWGIAAALVALGALEAWRRKGAARWMALYVGACIFCYGSHLAAFAMLAAAVGSVGLIRAYLKKQTWTRSALELVPFALMAGYHLLLVPAHPESLSGPLNHNTVADKFGHFIESMFVRQNYVVDRTILALFWGILMTAIWFGMRRRVRVPMELATICAVAAGIYFVLPFGSGVIFYMDERALPFLFIPLLLLSLRVFEDAAPDRRQISILIAACSLLAAANFGSLASFLPRQNREVAQFRSLLLAIPPHQIVLPIQTLPKDGNTWPLRHAGSFYTAERDGYIPYLFSGATGGGPSGYFSDLSPIYRPEQNWYMGREAPDWNRVVRGYDYIVITKPWERGRLPLEWLDLYDENSVATVFRVRKR
jgi:hypothetical protein